MCKGLATLVAIKLPFTSVDGHVVLQVGARFEGGITRFARVRSLIGMYKLVPLQ